MPTDERVLGLPTAHFHAVGEFQGFRAVDDAYRAALLRADQFSFRPRSEVETDPTFKQLIPYVVLKCGEQVFHYRRGSSGTETRLRALRSIGIGGHISEADAMGGVDPYRTGMLREVTEEVTIDCHYTERLLGVINDDRTLVGSVHLGIVHLFELSAPIVASREDALAEAGFASLADVWNQRDEMETWSQFVLQSLIDG